MLSAIDPRLNVNIWIKTLYSLEVAQVIPLTKFEVQVECGNYCLSSHLSNLSTIFQRAKHNRLSSYLESMHIISPLQFRFCKRHSTKGRNPYPHCHAYHPMTDKHFTYPPSLFIGPC